MTNRNVVVVMDFDENQKKAFEAIDSKATYTYGKASDLSEAVMKSADVIIGSVPVAKIKGSSRLKWLQLTSAGVNPYVGEGDFPAQAILTNASGAYGPAIAEHMLAMFLILMKKMHINRDNQHNHVWENAGSGQEIIGSTTLVIGLGDIGGSFAKVMKNLGSHVIGVRRTNLDKPDFVDEIHLIDKLDSLLPKADFIAMAMPGTAETSKVLSKERIALLKENAIVVNVGRGNALDTTALCDAVESGKIKGAGLEVTDPEPLPKEHRAWDIENIFITPHTSGTNSPELTGEKIKQMAIKNYHTFVTGGILPAVDLKKGY